MIKEIKPATAGLLQEVPSTGKDAYFVSKNHKNVENKELKNIIKKEDTQGQVSWSLVLLLMKTR